MLKTLSKTINATVTIIAIVSLVVGCGPVTPIANANINEAALQTATNESLNPNPNESSSSEDIWLDKSVDIHQFSPSSNFIVHFKNPVSLASSITPIFTWPNVTGINTWDEEGKTLTFNPAKPLDSKTTYTFFLDPELQYKNGNSLNPMEWAIYVQSGPKVLSVTPNAGATSNLFKTITVRFNKDMVALDIRSALTITPTLPFEVKWVSSKMLAITLKSPLAPNQRYNLSLKAGELVAEDGSILTDDYNWFYWQKPFTTTALVKGEKSVQFDFSYKLDTTKSGIPFKISPTLNGKWIWISDQTLQFLSDEVFSASTEYQLINTMRLTSLDGFEINQASVAKFSGKPPVNLVLAGFEKSTYGNGLYLGDHELDTIRIMFKAPVDHASAEEAFSLTPPVPGTFEWETVNGLSNEIMVYKLSELIPAGFDYTLEVDSSVLDLSGKRLMLQAYRQEFSFGNWYYQTPSFGESGDNIQVVDANGPRRLQISGDDPGISFTAYSFDISEYAALYASHYRHRSYSAVRDIPIPESLSPTLTWYYTEQRKVEDGSITETVIPPDLLPGLYVVNMKVKNRLYDQLFVVVSENTLLIKHNGEDLNLWVTNIKGLVVANAEVQVYSSSGEKIREGVTDENGQYKVSIPPGSQPLLISAFVKSPGQPNDAVVAGLDYPWHSYLPYDYEEWQSDGQLPEGKPFITYIYTERPLYRPGQMVNFKVILREDDDVKYSLLDPSTPVKVRVKDARGNTIAEYDMTTNEFGTVNGSVEISKEAMLGSYSIEVETGGVMSERTFKVEDYRKPDYQVALTSLQPENEGHYIEGEEVQFKIHTEYYFGEPLKDAKVEVDFSSGWYPLDINLPGRLITDKNGDFLLVFRAPYDRYSYSSWYWGATERMQPIKVQVRVMDGSNQSVTAIQTIFVHPAAEELNINTGGYFQNPSEQFSISVTDKTLSGEPVSNREISLVLYKWNSEEYKFDTKSNSYELQTDKNGVATQELTLPPGYYKLSLSSKDGEGRKMEYNRGLYVFKNKNDWTQTSREYQVQIFSEKESYKPYEKARFMIESSFSGPALITFERGSVINSKLIELTAPLTIFETDIIPEHAPNVYVTVNAWQPVGVDVSRFGWDWGITGADSYLRMDQTQVLVDATAKALDIEIATDQQTYEPGGQVSATITVNDAQGEPVAAELSLAVVDEAIFGLENPFEPNIFDAFYGPRAHTVDTFDSMSPYRIIAEGGNGGGGDDTPPEIRQDFLDTSTWLPIIRTDKNGKGFITFDLPDNTTSWRLMVKAVTLDHKVGEAKTNIETKKEVFLRPVLPRVLTRGDKAYLTSFIHNYSKVEKTLTVQIEAEGLLLKDNATQTILLKSGEVVPISWHVIVDRSTPTHFKVIVRDGNHILDTVEMPVVIQPAAVLNVQNQSGEFSGTLALPVYIPNVDTDTSQVILSLNQSLGGTMLNGLDYLIGYPYGCVEQTMSRALPNAVVARASKQLGIGGPDLTKRLDPYIQASIAKIYSLQHSDGGWGWWQYDSSTQYQTAWVLFGLGLINQAGYEVSPDVINSAAEWLSSSIQNNDSDDIRTRAYVLYSLSVVGKGNLEATQKLVNESIYELDPFSQAALASALNKMGETEQAREILNLLSQSAIEKEGKVYWPQPSHDGEYTRKTMASTARTTAMVLLAFAEIEPQNELVSGAVEYMASERKGVYGWGTTNETSFAILALTEHLISQENTSGPTPYQVNVNGKELFTGILETGHTSAHLEIPMALVHKSKSRRNRFVRMKSYATL